MATPRQVAANRANAKKSTGPKTDGGKAVSASNARKHGLFGRDVAFLQEDPEAFDALVSGLRAQFHPGSALEEELVDQLALAFWRNRRLAKAERNGLNKYLRHQLKYSSDGQDETTPASFSVSQLVLYGRYQAMLTNEVRRNLQMLAEAQDRRLNALEGLAEDVTDEDSGS